MEGLDQNQAYCDTGDKFYIFIISILFIILLNSCATTGPDFPGYHSTHKSKTINYKPIKKYKK